MSHTPQKRLKRCRRRRDTNKYNGIDDATTFDLSDDVLENIFSFFPIKRAVRMGLLSTRFKTSWVFNRNLYFDKEFARGRTRSKFIEVVTRVLHGHSGSSIKTLSLYLDPTDVEFTVEDWIRRAIAKGVEELDLDFSSGRKECKLDSEIFDIESIRVMKLSFCKLDLPPSTFKGLRFLNTLALRKVSVTAILIETILCNCLFLENLDLVQCSKLRHLKIFAQNLKKFKMLKVGDCCDISLVSIDAPTLCSIYYRGKVCDIEFEGDVLQLNDVMLNFAPAKGFIQHSEMRNLALNLTNVSVLAISSTFLEGLSPNLVEGELGQVQYNLWNLNLKEFQLFMEGTSYINPYDIAFFLRNCPFLEKIFIDLNEFSFECGHFWGLHGKRKFEQCNQSFQFLKSVKVKGFKFQRLEQELVKFFLAKATFLETLALVTDKNYYYPKTSALDEKVEQHFLPWSASPNAKIVICDHSNDQSFIYPKHSKIWY